jgi:nitroimidazol reductase NimA-like FMN-containing flavoprotein (pyridoxamine 5'-phosphate oxidase superfamily)
MAAKTYHLRREDRSMSEWSELLAVIDRQRHMTIAMAKDNNPYLATVNYAFDESSNCFYFHCASTGKKVDYLKSNSIVWGQILEDLGYMDGDCDYAYRTVQFRGESKLIVRGAEKRKALNLMIEKLEKIPAAAKKKFIKESSLSKVLTVRIDVTEMAGKSNVPRTN